MEDSLPAMKEEDKANAATQSPALTAHVKREIVSDVMQTQESYDSLQARTGMTPSRHNNFYPWIPFPLGQPVVPEAAVVTYSERRLNSLEWAELLDQTECLEYVSPDIDECIAQQSRVEGNQELELTGKEFVDSPPIPILPPLKTLSSANSVTISKPAMGPQRNVSRRPGLREQFPRHQSLMENNRVHFPDNYPAVAEQPLEMKRPTRRCTSVAKRSTDNPTSRSTSRSLTFEPHQQLKSQTRRKPVDLHVLFPLQTDASASQRESRRTALFLVARKVLAREDYANVTAVVSGALIQVALAVTKEVDSALRMVEANDAPVKDAKTLPSLADSARATEVERGAAQKAAPKAAKPETANDRDISRSTSFSELREEDGHQCRECACRNVVSNKLK
ncbi:hypothetical protein P3T76_008652 [Phytophthora citrophthora]|uniref:Uncharacterized protein n=1 Tax=Phytophthora citrophthora TaxID=4793 RepID=A0AAD9GJ41_9STRA|nr:hypothetical protein P3T76_008652 [Phytophthora citrophthora]